VPITLDTLRALGARLDALVQEFQALVAQQKAEEETSARGQYPEPRILSRKP
jgi:hypothetical protein